MRMCHKFYIKVCRVLQIRSGMSLTRLTRLKGNKTSPSYIINSLSLTEPRRRATMMAIDHEIQHLAWYSLLLWPAKFPLSPSCLAIMACTRPITPHGKQQKIVDKIPHTYQHVVFCSPGCNKWKQVYNIWWGKICTYVWSNAGESYNKTLNRKE